MNIDDPSKLSIRHRLRFLAKDSLVYGGAAAVNKAFALITFPLLARHFSVEDYGLIDLFTVAGNLLAILFIFGQDSAVARYFYEYKNTDERKQIVSQSLVFQLACILVALPCFWIFSSSLAARFHASPESPLLLKIILLQIPFIVLSNFSSNLLKWTFSRSRYLIISLGSIIVNVSLLLIAVLVFDIGVAGVFVVGLIVRIVFSGLGVLFVRQWITLPIGISFIRRLLPFAIPYGIICCAGAFVPVMERSLVDSLIGSKELGLYAAGTKVAMLLMLFVQAFQTAWGPFSLAIYKKPDAARTYGLVLKGFVMLVCIAVLLLSSIGHVLISILASNKYDGAAVVVFPLAMGLAIQGTSWITEIGIGLSKKSYLALYSYLVFVLATCVSIYFLAALFGLVGIAFGVMVGQAAKAISATWLAQRAYPLSWPFSSAIVLLVVTLAVGITSLQVSVAFGAVPATTCLLLGVVLLMTVGWLHTLNASERDHIRAALTTLGSNSG